MQFTIFAGSIVGLFFWNRSESRADIRHMDAKLDAYMLGIRTEIKAIHDEMKDFHARLCAIEERNRK